MTRDVFVAMLEPLALAMRAELDQPTWGAYYRVLGDVPAAVLSATVDAAMREPLEFFPKAGELRAKAEQQRRNLLALHPHEACCECQDSKGWRLVVMTPQRTAVARCPCVKRHQTHLEELGLLTAIADLPGAGDEGVYPTAEQLPAAVQSRLKQIAGGKVMR